MRVIFVGQNDIEEFKEKINFFQKTPTVPEMPQNHSANYDPSASEFYVNKSLNHLLAVGNRGKFIFIDVWTTSVDSFTML